MSGALFNKEIRYGIGRLIAMPLLCVGAAYALYIVQRMQFEGLFSDVYQGATAITCAFIGLACGLWQAVFETRPGAWAFLRHRPATPSRIFLTKLSAALLFYVAIVGVPILGVIAWASRPGQMFGPWMWQMAIPSLMDMLAGSAYVPVGLLIASREARWFGSRILPLGLAICASICAFVPWAWLAPLLIIGAWLILLPAAWSSFVNRGAERRQGRLARLSVAATLLPAAISLPIFLAATIETVNEVLTVRPTTYHGRYYQVISGELFQVEYGPQSTKYRKTIEQDGVLLADAELTALPSGYAAAVQYAGFRDYLLHYRQAQAHFDMVNLASVPEARRWFWLHDQKIVEEWTKPELGRAELRRYIGSNGAVTERSQVVPFNTTFPTQHRQPLVLPIVEPHRVVKIDLGTGEVKTLFTAPEGEKTLSSAGAGAMNRSDTDKEIEWTAIATDAAVYIVEKGQVRFRRAHEPGFITVTIAPSEDGRIFGLLYTSENYWAAKQLFIRCDDQGNVLTRTEVPPSAMNWSPRSGFRQVIEAVAVPPGVIAADAVHSYLYEKVEWRHALSLVFAVIGGLANWLLIRRDAVGRGITILWIVVGLLGGFAGILLLLWTHSFPPRVRCAGCSRKRVVNRATCEHCGQTFAQPATNGIGIFDSTRTTAFAVTE